ncbi:MAG: hypothetical protein E6Y16_08515 [Veillonella sp.]|uniref:DUF1963 domain-containing protein n=1 Tax=Veillonella dispar TaxID=39778 RepID=A0A6N3BCD5_9FIRM|nr:hypothetical protein [Veillonella sp.]MBS5766126.1 hypothetical protein [Veillonella sp.]MDU4713140.1 hypothetical protein [Veillonella sp.]
MEKNGYVNFNFLDSKPNINNILVGLDLDYSNKVIAPDGHELALVAFIPIENLLTIAPQFKTDFQDMEYKDKAIYVFSYYDKEDYFLDYITEIDDAIQGYTKVIIGDKNQFKFNLDKFYPINPIENLDEMSFLGGQPEYLQQESYDFLEKYIFIGQILGMDLPEEVNEIFYLTENIGYIFINRDLSGGLFFVQTT